MKRFFCTLCKRQRRSRKWPSDISTTNGKVKDRLATCDWHGSRESIEPKKRSQQGNRMNG